MLKARLVKLVDTSNLKSGIKTNKNHEVEKVNHNNLHHYQPEIHVVHAEHSHPTILVLYHIYTNYPRRPG